MNNKHYSILLLLGVLFCTSSCTFDDDWDNPSNWYGSWYALRNEYEITGIDIDKTSATIHFSESDYFNYNRERFGSSHTVKYKRGIKEFDNGSTLVSFTFEKPLFVYPTYKYNGEEIVSETIVGVKTVYVTTPMNLWGFDEFEMLDDNQSTFVQFHSTVTYDY